MAGRPHPVGMSPAFGLDFASPTVYGDLQPWEPPTSLPDSLRARQLPYLPFYFSWGSSYYRPQASHRMWSAMELPLLRNAYSVLCAKYESLSCTLRGRDCRGESPS